jgi:Holliday junction DNA helicase RuvB
MEQVIIYVLIIIIIGVAIRTIFHNYTHSQLSKFHDSIPTIQIDETQFLIPTLSEPYLTLEKYTGQTKIVEYLKGHIKLAKSQGKSLPHTILWGSGGLGKSTLVRATANHIGGRFFEIIPANLRNTKELFAILFKKQCVSCKMLNPFSANKCLNCRTDITSKFIPINQFRDYDILFFEECHGLKNEIEEAIYSLMQDGYIMVRYLGIDQKVFFPKITIMGATTQLGNLTKPFRDRFGLELHLVPYTQNEMKIIITQYVMHKNYSITDDALELVAKISHGIPRIAKKYIIDAMTILSGDDTTITLVQINKILTLLNVNEDGLNELHIAGMGIIYKRMLASKNGGAGVNSVASAVGVPVEIWEEVYEPSLVYLGYLEYGSRGRRISEAAIRKYFTK